MHCFLTNIEHRHGRCRYVPPPHNTESEPPRRQRVSVACVRCRKRRIRCSGDRGNGLGCTNCSRAGVLDACQFHRVGDSLLESYLQQRRLAAPTCLSVLHEQQPIKPHATLSTGPLDPSSDSYHFPPVGNNNNNNTNNHPCTRQDLRLLPPPLPLTTYHYHHDTAAPAATPFPRWWDSGAQASHASLVPRTPDSDASPIFSYWSPQFTASDSGSSTATSPVKTEPGEDMSTDYCYTGSSSIGSDNGGASGGYYTCSSSEYRPRSQAQGWIHPGHLLSEDFGRFDNSLV
ncbi:hypothetical protein IWX49DRAFT_558334 [Phyllosticta citricarpa]|uniref:Zn(2)-C6 fungal-type domain-containing protein n=1 Tax=Phyllosticta paracitricarpa TaxID=2016321 RepID=A0ABR1MWF4_9PEZI